MKTVWANIDVTTKTFTVHGDRDCGSVSHIAETPYKGVDSLKRDGGWLSFGSRNAAMEEQRREFKNYKLIIHC
jgi:hypothetical protein